MVGVLRVNDGDSCSSKGLFYYVYVCIDKMDFKILALDFHFVKCASHI